MAWGPLVQKATRISLTSMKFMMFSLQAPCFHIPQEQKTDHAQLEVHYRQGRLRQARDFLKIILCNCLARSWLNHNQKTQWDSTWFNHPLDAVSAMSMSSQVLVQGLRTARQRSDEDLFSGEDLNPTNVWKSWPVTSSTIWNVSKLRSPCDWPNGLSIGIGGG